MKRLACWSALTLLIACGTPKSQQVRMDAKDRFDRANAQVVYDQAVQAFHAGQFETALSHADKAIARFPKEGSYQLLRGRILLEMKRVDLAQTSFREAVELAPTSAEPHYYMGIVLQRWHELDKAVDSYHRAAELDPSQLQYVAAECETLLFLGRLDDAQHRLDEVQRQFEFSPVLDHVRADLAGLRGQHGERDRWLQAARLRSDPSRSATLAEEIALVRFERGDWNGCIQALDDEALTILKGRADLTRLRARCLLMLDRPREARDLMLSLRTEPDAAGRNATIVGLAALRLGDVNRMTEAGHVLTRAQPGRADGWMLLGVAAAHRGDLAEARRLLGEAASREPQRELPRQLLTGLDRPAESMQGLARVGETR